MKKKEYEMPVDIQQMWLEYEAIYDIVERLIKIPFCLNKAIKLNKKKYTLKRIIEEKTHEIYPELKKVKIYKSEWWKDKIVVIEE